MNQHQSTGYLYAFGASLALAASFVFSKSVLNHLTMVQFGLIWFSMGVVWNGAWFLARRETRTLKDSFKAKTNVAIVIAVLYSLPLWGSRCCVKDSGTPRYWVYWLPSQVFL